MRTKLAQLLIAFLLVTTIGGHWALLQSVAWVRMAINYSSEGPLGTALMKTFDGNHPCQLCKAVKAGQQAEKEQASLKVETKLDFMLTFDSSLLDASRPADVILGQTDRSQSRFDSPPTPPPRLS